ncbi:MAG: LacI family transcriptional regulator [Kiritimatiellales bacterium]|nr:LacI family transcriptional regulator [Kiritimatiellales bacterium]
MATGGSKRVRVIDVANAVGVSKATAVFSLNDRYDIVISEPTRQRVKNMAAKMGYKPNPLAQALSTGKTGMINIVVPYINDPFFSRFLAHFQQIAFDAHLTPIVTANFNEDENADEFMERLIHWPCDAYILCYSKKLAAFLTERKIHLEKPVVYIGEKVDGIDSVYSDHQAAIAAILNHFSEDRRTDIVFVSDEKALHYINERYRLYLDHMKRIGRKPVELVVPERSRGAAYSTVREHLAAHKPPQAFFCYNDELAIGVQRAVQDSGYNVPDVAVSGFDGLPEGDYMNPRLTTVVYPYDKMCHAAWDLLEARKENLAGASNVVEFQSSFVQGGSTRLPDRVPSLTD